MPPIAAVLAVAAFSPSAPVLSDEWRTSAWAHPGARARVHAAPDGSARTLARLHPKTEMGDPEVYLMLTEQRDARGRTWVEIRLPGKPNGRTGWVLRRALGATHVSHTTLLVDKRQLTATLLVNGRARWRVPIGIGTRATPTPPGHFYVRELLQLHPASTAYGPYIFGTSGYARLSEFPGGGIIGIHGTSQPGLIPGRPSHGCVRMRNADIRALAKRLPIGSAVRIR
jgi:lipoprotein-anchoring transpeptidase ErfK/SrfK